MRYLVTYAIIIVGLTYFALPFSLSQETLEKGVHFWALLLAFVVMVFIVLMLQETVIGYNEQRKKYKLASRS